MLEYLTDSSSLIMDLSVVTAELNDAADTVSSQAYVQKVSCGDETMVLSITIYTSVTLKQHTHAYTLPISYYIVSKVTTCSLGSCFLLNETVSVKERTFDTCQPQDKWQPTHLSMDMTMSLRGFS